MPAQASSNRLFPDVHLRIHLLILGNPNSAGNDWTDAGGPSRQRSNSEVLDIYEIGRSRNSDRRLYGDPKRRRRRSRSPPS